MKRELELEALVDGKKARVESDLDNPHVVNSLQQQFLQQQQYLQQQLHHLQQQQMQNQPPPEHPWSIQGQSVPRPALPPHMLPYAMQSFLQSPYSQPLPFSQHQPPFLPFLPYHPGLNAHQMVSNPYVLQQQKDDEQKFTDFPDHTPSPSPSPNPPSVGESPAKEVSNAAPYDPSMVIPNEHSKEVSNYSENSYSSACAQSVTPVEYPSPVQSPVPPIPPIEHPASAVLNSSKGLQDINLYAGFPPKEVDASMRLPPAGVIDSPKELPQSRIPYAEVSSTVSTSSAIGDNSSVMDTPLDLSNYTTTIEGQSDRINITTQSKGSSAYLGSHHNPVHEHFNDFGSNPAVINYSQSALHSPAGNPIPSSPYTSSLPNPPPNSPVVPYVYHTSGSQSIKNDSDLALHSIGNIIEKPSDENDVNISENISKQSENTEKIHLISTSPHVSNGVHHGSIAAASQVVQTNNDKHNYSDSSYNNGYIGAFTTLIKSEEPNHNEYEDNLESEEYANGDNELNLENNQNHELNPDLGCMGLKIETDKINSEEHAEDGKQKEISIQNKNENDYERDCTEDKTEDNVEEWEEKKSFTFSPYLYEYLYREQREILIESTEDKKDDVEEWEENKFKFSPYHCEYPNWEKNSEQKEVESEASEWSSQLCTPPESPPATNYSTPTSSPTGTAPPIPFVTLTPCTTYSCPTDKNCTQDFSTSALSELRDDVGLICQGDDILMRSEDGSLRIGDSPVKFETSITGAFISPNHQLEPISPTLAYLPISATSSPGSDILGDVLTQVGLVGILAEEDMSLDEDVIGIMEEEGPSPSLIGEAQELGYHQQRQFACHLCHCIFHDLWNLQVHMVSHPTPTPRPSHRSQSSITSPGTSPSEQQGYREFIPPHLTPSLPKRTRFRRGGRRAANKENISPQRSQIGKYKCSDCNLDYVTLGHMKRHMESHGANRRFACDMCTASYSRHDNLKKHRDQHMQKYL